MAKYYRGGHLFWAVSRHRVRRFLLAIPVVLFGYLMIAGNTGLYQIWHRKQKIVALHQDIDSLKAENAHLEEEARLLKTDMKTIERIARERYGMVKKNESVYMVYPHPPETGTEDKR